MDVNYWFKIDSVKTTLGSTPFALREHPRLNTSAISIAELVYIMLFWYINYIRGWYLNGALILRTSRHAKCVGNHRLLTVSSLNLSSNGKRHTLNEAKLYNNRNFSQICVPIPNEFSIWNGGQNRNRTPTFPLHIVSMRHLRWTTKLNWYYNQHTHK